MIIAAGKLPPAPSYAMSDNVSSGWGQPYSWAVCQPRTAFLFLIHEIRRESASFGAISPGFASNQQVSAMKTKLAALSLAVACIMPAAAQQDTSATRTPQPGVAHSHEEGFPWGLLGLLGLAGLLGLRRDKYAVR